MNPGVRPPDDLGTLRAILLDLDPEARDQLLALDFEQRNTLLDYDVEELASLLDLTCAEVRLTAANLPRFRRLRLVDLLTLPAVLRWWGEELRRWRATMRLVGEQGRAEGYPRCCIWCFQWIWCPLWSRSWVRPLCDAYVRVAGDRLIDGEGGHVPCPWCLGRDLIGRGIRASASTGEGPS